MNSRRCMCPPLIADAHLERIYPDGTETRAYLTGNEPIIFNSGDKNFDTALAHTLAKLSKWLEVLPGFAYYDDTQSGQNAYATSRVRLSRARMHRFRPFSEPDQLNHTRSWAACITITSGFRFSVHTGTEI